MALKKDIFNKYIKTRSSDELDDALRRKRKFTHNRVFHLSSEDENKKNSNGSQTVVKENSNGSQTVVKKNNIKKYIGLQRKILEHLFLCIENHSTRVTKPLTIDEIMLAIESTRNMIKQGVYRCKTKGVISIEDRKNGRGGWCQYKLSKSIYDSISDENYNDKDFKENVKQNNLNPIYNSNSITTNINKYKKLSDSLQPNDTDKDQIIADLQKQLELQNQRLNHQSQSTTSQSEKDRLTDHINKKLNDINTQTDTENPADTQDDSEAWANIDFSALADYGFKKSHIKQIINANTSLTPQEVQDSIEHYAWALENRREEMKGYAPVSNPLRGLMGVLKKGNAWVEGSYKSPEELALELQIKNKRMQLERQQEKKDELFNIEFEMWYTELTPKDIAKIEATNGFKSMPIATFNKKMGSSMYRSLMQGYFRDKILK